MSDWFDSDDEETPAKRGLKHQAQKAQASVVRPPPRSPLIDEERLAKLADDQLNAWIDHEKELNRPNRSLLGRDEPDEIALRDDIQDDGMQDDSMQDADVEEDAQDPSQA